MAEITGKLTVYYEPPFWTGVFERTEDGHLTASRIVFGAEPKEHEIYGFVLEHYDELEFSPAVENNVTERKINPKRLQREIHRQMERKGTGTKAQQALKMQHEQFRAEKKRQSGLRKEADRQRRYELHKLKKKKKHRGR